MTDPGLLQIYEIVRRFSSNQADAHRVLPLGFDTTTYRPLHVDTDGDLQVDILSGGGGGGGTQYQVDSVAGATDTGTLALLVRDDALTTLTPVDGDYVQGRTNARGAKWVAIEDGAGGQITSFGGGVQYTEGDTDASITGTAMMMEGAANTLVVAQGTAADGLLVNLGTNNDVTVTGSVTADTELPTAVALTDNFANPTAPAVGAFNMLWDGATWDRAAGTSVDGALVNLGANNDVTVTGTVTADTELPAAAALADNTVNPTVPAVGSFLMGYDGTTWDRVLVGAPSADNVTSAQFPGLLALTVGYAFDGTNFDRIRLEGTLGGLTVGGSVAHAVADAGNPVKIGSKAYSLDPSSAGTIPGPTDVTADNRANLFGSLKGAVVEAVHSVRHTLSAIIAVYDDSPTSNNSATIDAWYWRWATVSIAAETDAGTPTDIQIIVQVSEDNSAWSDLVNGPLGQWIYDDTFLASNKVRAYSFPICARYVRVRIVCTGTDASNRFEVTDAWIHLRN